MDREIFKMISIRGRFAFGLFCLENLIECYQIKSDLLDEIIKDIGNFTDLKKLGAMEDYFYNIKPWCVESDFPKIKDNPHKLHEFGYDDFSLDDLKNLYELYQLLPGDLKAILNNLTSIANSQISAGCGEYSPLTLEPTLKIIDIMEKHSHAQMPNIEKFLFSGFSENHGWGNRFNYKKITNRQHHV
jgi:hypothetical protein